MKSRNLLFILAAGSSALLCSQPLKAQVFITEVAPWSSGNSPIAADWFEVSNRGTSSVDVTGWKMDDNSASFSLAVPMSGVSSIAPGESVIFIETSTLASTAAAFSTLWFGANPPSNLQIGAYSGAGVGLSASADAVNLYDSTGVLQASVNFNASPTGPFSTFDNSAGLNNAVISQLSVVGVNGAFAAAGDSNEIGSPGIAAAPEPGTITLVLTGLAALGFSHRFRKNAE